MGQILCQKTEKILRNNKERFSLVALKAQFFRKVGKLLQNSRRVPSPSETDGDSLFQKLERFLSKAEKRENIRKQISHTMGKPLT